MADELIERTAARPSPSRASGAARTRCRAKKIRIGRHDREMGQQRIDLAEDAVALALHDDVASRPRRRRSSS